MAQAWIASNAVGLVFQLRLRSGLTEVQLSKVPAELLVEALTPRFLRVTEVSSQKATLTLFSSRGGALREDEQGIQLAPMVSATTLGLIGAEFLPIERYWREIVIEESDDVSEEGSDENGDESRAARAAANAAAAAEAAAAAAAAPSLSEDELVMLIMDKVGVSLETASDMVNVCGVASREDLEQLVGEDESVIDSFANEVNMSLMEKIKLKKFTRVAKPKTTVVRAMSGGRGKEWLTGVGADDAASEEAGPVVSAPAKNSNVRGTAGGDEVEKLLGGVSLAESASVAIACINLLVPAMMQREVRKEEMKRPLPQLGALLRGLEKKGVKILVAAPGGKEEVMDGVQEACIDVELGISSNAGGQQQQQQQQPSSGNQANAALMHSLVYGGGAAGTTEKSQEDRAIVEALSFLDKDAKVSAALETLASSGPENDAALAKALAQLGNEDALRGLIYMKKDSVRIPPGVIASAHHLSIIKSIVRLRTRIVEAGAEKLRPLLPAAGTKAGTPAEIAEAVWSGNLLQHKFHKLFQPEKGSTLLAATQGGKKEDSQTPVELIVRGIMVLTVAYDHAHGSYDPAVLLTFAKLQSVVLDATQKGVPPDAAASLVLETTLGEAQRLWKQATSGIGERPLLADVAKALEHRMMTMLSVEVAHAAAKRPVTPEKGKEAGGDSGKGGKESQALEKLQRSLAELEKRVGAGKEPSGGGKETFRQKLEAWEAANPGQCWFMTNQREKCKKGESCPHFKTHAGHTS